MPAAFVGRRDALGLATLFVFGVGSCKRLFGPGDGMKDVASVPDKNGKKRVLSVPASWTEDVEKNPAAEIASGSRADDAYVMVICEPKADFPGYSLDRYSDLTRSQVMKNLIGGKSGAKVKSQIADHPAIEVELRGGFRDGSTDADGGSQTTNLVYLHTSIELEASYCQVVGFTNGRRWDTASTTLRKIAQTFREEG
jgi:hypothetical protein